MSEDKPIPPNKKRQQRLLRTQNKFWDFVNSIELLKPVSVLLIGILLPKLHHHDILDFYHFFFIHLDTRNNRNI